MPSVRGRIPPNPNDTCLRGHQRCGSLTPVGWSRPGCLLSLSYRLGDAGWPHRVTPGLCLPLPRGARGREIHLFRGAISSVPDGALDLPHPSGGFRASFTTVTKPGIAVPVSHIPPDVCPLCRRSSWGAPWSMNDCWV